MTFRTCPCPDCGMHTIVDDVVPQGFCMYCGSRIDTSGGEVDEDLDRLLSVYLSASVGDFSDQPWYGDMEGAFRFLDALEFEAAVKAYEDASEDTDPKTRVDMDMAFLERVCSAIIDAVRDGEDMDGISLEPLYAMYRRHGTFRAEQVAGVAMGSLINTAYEDDSAEALVSAAYGLLIDALGNIPGILYQGILLNSFVGGCDDLADEFESVSDMVEAAYILDTALVDAAEDLDPDDLIALEAHWSEAGLDAVSDRSAEALRSVLEAGFAATDGDWEVIEKLSDDYANAYLEPLSGIERSE